MVLEEKMFENVDGRMTDDGRTDDGVTGILLAHPWAFGSGELKSKLAVQCMCHKFGEFGKFVKTGWYFSCLYLLLKSAHMCRNDRYQSVSYSWQFETIRRELEPTGWSPLLFKLHGLSNTKIKILQKFRLPTVRNVSKYQKLLFIWIFKKQKT